MWRGGPLRGRYVGRGWIRMVYRIWEMGWGYGERGFCGGGWGWCVREGEPRISRMGTKDLLNGSGRAPLERGCSAMRQASAGGVRGDGAGVSEPCHRKGLMTVTPP